MSNNQITIGINALYLIPNRVGGTEYYLRSFLQNLHYQASKFKFIVFCNNENYETFNFVHSNWSKVKCPIWAENRISRILYEQFILPIVAHKHSCDLIHSFGYFGPIITPMPHVVTVHDVNWKDFPEDTSIFTNYILEFLITNCMKKAKKVITDSEFSAKRIKYYFPQVSAKLVIIQPGVDPLFHLDIPGPSSKYSYMLCVSSFYPHKRVLYLLKLWKRLYSEIPHMKLIIVGQNGKDQNRVLKHIVSMKNVTYFKKVTFKQLVALYRYAELIIHPSVYEGFGYPVYEALSLNKKLIVGAAKLYDERILNRIHQLTFSIVKDVLLVKSLLEQDNANTPFKLNYADSIVVLEKLYNGIAHEKT